MYHRAFCRPMLKKIKSAKIMAEQLKRRNTKHWWIKGDNSVAMAVHLLQIGDIIAIPTDTIYGLAGLAKSPSVCARLYEIKERSSFKPLAVCLSSVCQINEWAVVNHVPPSLLEALFPGTITVLLPRKPDEYQHLNPGAQNVGIRIPTSPFVRKVTELAGPLVLTSANISNQPSSVKPEEFCGLWPKLGGIFHTITDKSACIHNRNKLASTIVDLSVPDQYHIVRYGKNSNKIITTLRSFNLRPKLTIMKEKEDNEALMEKTVS